MPPSPRRLIYNYDAWGVFLWVKEVADIRKNVDLFAGSQVTTIMLCPNMGQSTVYPSKVSELCHWREQGATERVKFHHELGTLFAQASERVAKLWREQGIDAFGLLVQAVVNSGREAFATIRMNDVHCLTAEERRGPYTDKFYRDNPEYRLQASGGATPSASSPPPTATSANGRSANGASWRASSGTASRRSRRWSSSIAALPTARRWSRPTTPA